MSEVLRDEEIVEKVTTVEETATVDSDIVSDEVDFDDENEDDGSYVEAVDYPKLRTKDDGLAGLPVFTNAELHVINKNILVDLDNITHHREIMADMVNSINDTKLDEDHTEEDIRPLLNVYHSSRNVLIELQKSHDEYIQFVRENKEEILSHISDDVDKIIDAYIADKEEKNPVLGKYEDGTFRSFLIANVLRERIAYGNKDGKVAKFISGKGKSFPHELVSDIINSFVFFASNGSSSTDIGMPNFEERDLIRIASKVIRDMDKIGITGFQTMHSDLDQKHLLGNYIVKLSELLSKEPTYNFISERKKFNTKAYQARKALDDRNYSLPLTDDLVRSRFRASVIEVMIKEWFSITMYGNHNIIKDKDALMEKFNDVNSYSSRQIVIAIIASFSFELLFEGLRDLVSYTTEALGRKINSKDMTTLKNYIVFIALSKRSVKEADISLLYNIESMYNLYVESIAAESYNGLVKSLMITDK